MLTLTQLSVGAFGLSLLVERLVGRSAGSPLAQTVFACSLALIALAASVFHLGRPWLAYRAVLGLRTSWLSREALAFGLFAKLAVLYGLLVAAPLLPEFPFKAQLLALAEPVHSAAAVMGALGVFCSVMVYVATKRVQWSGTQTGIKFFGTAVSLGAAAVLTVYAFTGQSVGTVDRVSHALLWLVLTVTALKLSFEASALRHVTERRYSVLKRMALLMLGDLRAATAARFGFGLAGGVALPALLVSGSIHGSNAPWVTGLALGCLLLSELAERYLFFRAAPGSRMPGGIR
jgi:DMSO reductase anchor subunit